MIIIKNRDIREKMVKYAERIWNFGNAITKEEYQEAVAAYMYDDNGLTYIRILTEDIFEENRINGGNAENMDYTAINLYYDILANATKKGKQLIKDTFERYYAELDRANAERIAAELASVALENIDG